MTRKPKPTVVDFFSGAGGFSEGFRQQGFEVVMGVDNWRPAVETHNLNHGLKDVPMDVLRYGKSVEAIETDIPDTDVIVGSPPCVLFSMSNRAGKADKSLGIELIRSYLRVIAVKKHKPHSKLKAWLMENVPNSRNYVKPTYTFSDLGLADWAKDNDLEPRNIALHVQENGDIIVASDYGAPQKRERFVCGEITKDGSFPAPVRTHLEPITLDQIKGSMPSPTDSRTKKEWDDPNYPRLKLEARNIPDHFYDTGVYEVEWRAARFAKVNHPFMGKMAFPEDEGRPSRTIMATRSASTREALLYRSEYDRKGDGEFRLPTIREAASLMGFPYSYRFTGGEGTKWRLIGNAVCPPMAIALAKAIRKWIGLRPIAPSEVDFKMPEPDSASYVDLNDWQEKKFDLPPRRKPGSRFRRHPFKEGNMTVALMNYDPNEGPDVGSNGRSWYAVACIGSGKTHHFEVLPAEAYRGLKKIIVAEYQVAGSRFVTEFERRFKDTRATAGLLQEMHETNKDIGKHKEPGKLVDEVASFIEEFGMDSGPDEVFDIGLETKDVVPRRQLLALYGVSWLASKADSRYRAGKRQTEKVEEVSS